ncbi:MAG: patatin-like phospholipase family protein [Gammaproteobacteria bacterium]|nr:patatin-like phospholipase family protein [Gammaproteobacteria bacterium]
MTRTTALSFRAGPGALRTIRQHGFSPELVGTMAGASGGAKWLVLSKLDRVAADTLIPRLHEPVYLIGSSIGAWRFACYAQDRPLEAIERFEEAYLGQTYSEEPDRDEITTKSRQILDYVLGESGTAEILSHPVFRTSIMTVRSRHVTASEQPAVLVPGLLAAAALNAVSRRSLGAFFERVLFFDARDLPPFFDMRGFPLRQVELAEANLKDAIIATGSIPMILSGVRDIAGAPRGMYRDGGVIDYHLDLPQSAPDRLTLYLHFIDRIVPGWFDKKLSWRKPDPSNVDRTILVSPSKEFVSRLPHAKIPDRRDFINFKPEERIRAWRTVVDMCDELADEFHEVLDKGQLAARLEPL